MTQVTDELARLVEQLGGERTSTDAGAVCLHDAEYLTNLVGTDAQTRAGTSTDGIGGSNERIRAEVDVEHRALGTLAENALARAQHLVDLVLRVDQVELAQIVDTL